MLLSAMHCGGSAGDAGAADASSPARDAIRSYRWPAPNLNHETRSASEKHSIVYVLSLADDKFYVGYTTNFRERMRSHFSGCGSAWTRKYKPIKVVETLDRNAEGNSVDEIDENTVTKRYMQRYGISNVRGGAYCAEVLDEAIVKFLKRELNVGCHECGSESHYVRSCPIVLERRARSQLRSVEPLYCARCCRTNHSTSQCYARNDISGTPLPMNVYRQFLHDSAQRFAPMEATPPPAPEPATGIGKLYSFYAWVQQAIFNKR